MDDLIEKIIFLAIGVAILFYSLAYVIIPAFQPLYEHCGADEPYPSGRGTSLSNSCCQTGSSTVTACANCNGTSGYSTFLNTCGSLISTSNNTHCYQCASFGNKGVYQGLFFLMFLIVIFVLILTVIYFAIRKPK